MTETLSIAVNAPLHQELTYSLPEGMTGKNLIGSLVNTPLGSRTVQGIITGVGETSKDDSKKSKLKAIKEVHPENISIPLPYLKWLKWVSQYYHYPIGQTAQMCIPPLKRAVSKRQKSRKTSAIPTGAQTEPQKLTAEQKVCLEGLNSKPGFGVHLLHGVTGSGKTEVYLQFLAGILKSGKQALVLVPEISLTPQLLERFSSRFPDKVAVIHSHLTNREKTDQWWHAYSGEKQILLGARSALFCPLKNLGAIIIDEEHEASFKQEETLKYHARDAAIVLAKGLNCPVVLGSATPSIETWNHAIQNKYHLHQMKKRVSDRPLPDISVVDMREVKRQRKDSLSTLPFWLSESLYQEMIETFKRGEQVALFLNRRGVAQTVFCQSCGHTYECPNCSISLTLHVKTHLVCHYCNYTEPLKDRCKECNSDDVVPLGMGTEQIEQTTRELFPDITIARADRDEIQSREDLEALVKDMEEGRIDLLIGTQMIAKGLDFPKLQTVGLVLADVGFNLPDFRTSERSFQLLTQVSGRAGRHSTTPGKVIVQTYNPEFESLKYSVQTDYEGFAKYELQNRQELSYPPFSRIACIRIQGQIHNRVSEASDMLERRAQILKSKSELYSDLKILGPVPASLAKLRGKFRYHLLIKAGKPNHLQKYLSQLLSDLSWLPPATKVQIDVDPINML